MEVKFDREALRKLVDELRIPTEENAWCIACGASRGGADKLDIPEDILKTTVTQFVQPEALRELVTTLQSKSMLNESADWCIACGASSAKISPPFERIDPSVKISDKFIDNLSSKLITAVRVE